MKQLLAFLKATLLGVVVLMSFKDFPPRQETRQLHHRKGDGSPNE